MTIRHQQTFRLLAASLSLICGLAFLQPAMAQAIGNASSAKTPGIAWEQLSAEQQQVLASVQANWHTLPPGRQVALANGAKRFGSMNAEQRSAAAGRFADWRKLSDAERTEIGERYRLFGGLPPHEKQRLRQIAKRYDRMNPEQRQRMRERFQQLTPEQRMRLREQMRERQLPQRRK